MINCTFEDGNKASLRHVVVHAIVENDGKILLVKRKPHLLEGGKWGLPSGFLDRDETAEQGTLRELKEETGWEGEIISLFRINSNPNRPMEDRQNVVIEFTVKPLHKVSERDNESTEVEWIPEDDIPNLGELAFDHGETIKLYLEYKKNPHALPLIV